jgi:hypothetical protein
MKKPITVQKGGRSGQAFRLSPLTSQILGGNVARLFNEI